MCLTAASFVVFLFALLDSARTDFPFNDDSHNQYALDLYQALRNQSENIVTSPVSLQITLALAKQGAGGTTEAEIAKVLRHAGNHSEVLETYKALIKELQDHDVKMATKMFVEKSSNLSPDFQNISNTYFLSKIQGIDFKGNPEESRKEINNWTENNTNHNTRVPFSKGSLTSLTKLVLINTIHFKAKWRKQFNLKKTRDQVFNITQKESVIVKMMTSDYNNISHMYSEKLKSDIFEIPYDKKGLRMIIILPSEYYGLPEVESKLNTVDIFTELLQLKVSEFYVELPRFELEENMDLGSILQKMGMPTAFSNMADFSKISNESLKIDKVVQKSFIEVNEEGTEPPEYDGGIMVRYCNGYAPPRIKCDHPFLYMIVKENKILLIGRLVKPEQVKNPPKRIYDCSTYL